MKKIMFNDRFGLTQAVLDGRKTQTRRNFTLTLHKKADKSNELIEVSPTKVYFEDGKWKFVYDNYIFLLPGKNYPKYKVGEVVAIAQSYEDSWKDNADCYSNPYFLKGEKGWNNKMFVRADLMPHQIRITNVRIERLQDISDEDCLKEGLEWDGVACQYYVNYKKETGHKTFLGETPREAFAHLIDKVSGKGTFESNPYVWVYDFELIK